VWTTGAAVRRCDYWDGTEYDEVLSLKPGAVRLERLNNGAPLLDTHCSYQLDNVIGVVVEGTAKIEDGRGIATVLLSKAEGIADTVTKIREGVIKNISVGYWIHKIEKTESDDGKVARWDVVDWEPLEVSAVPIPADPSAQFRSEKRADDSEESLRSCVFVTREKPAAAPNRNKGKSMTKKVGKRAAVKTAEQEAEEKRLAALRASKREDEKKDEDKDEDADDERDADDMDADEENASDDSDSGKDKDADEENAADDDDDADDDSDNHDDGQSDDKRKVMTPAEVRKAAEAAVRADRIRGAEIREIAARFGFPKLGEKHANGETSVRKFKDIVLDKLAARQAKRGSTTFAASGSRDLEPAATGSETSHKRAYDKGAAEAIALLGKAK
jgi:phage head maturation protease